MNSSAERWGCDTDVAVAALDPSHVAQERSACGWTSVASSLAVSDALVGQAAVHNGLTPSGHRE
jgi:hypothetical protein